MGPLASSIAFIFGLFIGSFLNVVADRINYPRTIVFGRSHCDKCKRELTWSELIPVISFLLQRGQCKHCHTTLSLRYPISELLTGFCFGLVVFFITSQSLAALILLLLITACLLVIILTDSKYEIIPFSVVAVASVGAVGYLLVEEPAQIIPHLLTAIGSSLFFYLIYFLTKGRGMGFGDVVYAALMGLLLGFPNVLLGLYIAFVSGAIVALILVLLKKKKLHGGTIPFGPFLVFGTFCMMIWGDQIFRLVSLYLGLKV